MTIELHLKKLAYNLNPQVYTLLNKLAEKVVTQFNSPKEKNRQEYRDADYLLISFGHSGRTWLRIMLGFYLKLHYNIDDIDLHHLYSFSQKNPHIPSIKSLHTTYKQFHSTYHNKSLILLVRDPRDVIISSYYSRLRLGKIVDVSLSEFIPVFNLENTLIKMYNDFYENREETKSFLVVRYEDLKLSTAEELKRLLIFVGITPQDIYINQAIEYASLENMKKYELEGNNLIKSGPLLATRKKNLNQETNLLKIRNGRVGNYCEEFSPATLEALENLINNQLNPYFRYNYYTQDQSKKVL